MPTKMRSFRAPDDIWEQAKAYAHATGTSLSDLLTDYMTSLVGAAPSRRQQEVLDALVWSRIQSVVIRKALRAVELALSEMPKPTVVATARHKAVRAAPSFGLGGKPLDEEVGGAAAIVEERLTPPPMPVVPLDRPGHGPVFSSRPRRLKTDPAIPLRDPATCEHPVEDLKTIFGVKWCICGTEVGS